MTVRTRWWELALAIGVGVGSGLLAGSIASGLVWRFGRTWLGG